MAEIVLVRHGETAWSREGRHTGRTDIPLTAQGRARAAQAGRLLAGRTWGLALASPLGRARETAALAGVVPDALDDDLVEWDYGAWEGRTTAQVRADLGDPGWLIWDHRVPPGRTPGEQPAQVAERAARVLARCAPVLAAGQDCVLVAHGHVLRILTATWLALPAAAGRCFALDAGAVSALGFEHETRVIQRWNVAAGPAGAPARADA